LIIIAGACSSYYSSIYRYQIGSSFVLTIKYLQFTSNIIYTHIHHVITVLTHTDITIFTIDLS